MTLSTEQQTFVDFSVQGHARLLAGPGTGKSHTCVALLEHLALQNPKPRCHMITFTRAATKELQDKIQDGAVALTTRPPSTAHSFAMSVLMKGDPDLRVRMADDWEKRVIIDEVIKNRLQAVGHDANIRLVQRLTNEMAAGWESLDEQKLELVDQDPALAQAFRGCWMEAQRTLDFLHVSEIPYRACELMEDQNVDVELDVLVVDEYQDLNRAEVKFIELLAQQLSVVAIGDDDQSIYGWRQAAPDALLDFCNKYQTAGHILTKCFRCGDAILAPANAVIAAATGRPPKPALESCRSEPGTFAHLKFANSTAEFLSVGKLIKQRVDDGVPPNEIAVLVRSSASRFRAELAEVLSKYNIAVTDPDWVSEALKEDEVRRLLALGRLLDEPEDSLAWFSYLRTTAGIGWSTLNVLYDLACSDNVTFYAKLAQEEAAGFPGLKGTGRNRTASAVTEARLVLAELDGKRQGVTLGAGGWGGWLLGHGDPAKMSDNARRIFAEVGELLMLDAEPSLSAFINNLPPMAKDLATSDENAVRLMSMGMSKGLTVNTAILMGVDNKTLPLPAGDFEEERRILYVAMTRATDFSIITFAQRRTGATARVGAGGGARQRSSLLSGLPNVPSPVPGPSWVTALSEGG